MIEDFRSSFTEELSKPSRFSVIINPPAASTQLSSIIDSKTLSFRCETAVLPGRNLSTADLRIYGPTEKYPYQSTYDDISLTFICTDSMAEKTFFNSWMDIINPTNTWNFKFKKEYVTDININQYDNVGNVSHTVRIIDAFPLSVNQLDLDWSNGDTYHKLTVSLAYTYWTTDVNQQTLLPESVPLDGQALANIPGLLKSNPDTIPLGTYIDITNQAIGPYNTFKDQYASAINKVNQIQNILK